MKPANSSDNDGVEMQHLVADDLEQGNRAKTSQEMSKPKTDGIFQRFMLLLDEHVNVKILIRQWRPRLEFIVRLMLVATFLDDSFRTATQFSELTTRISEQGCVSWLGLGVNARVAIATVVLGAGFFAQVLGSLCLLVLFRPDGSTKALIGWAIMQPFLYAQISNVEFVAESLSIIGGLFLLRAHLVYNQTSYGAGARTQLLGRLLLPAMYLYYAGHFLFLAFTLDETDSLAVYISSLSMFVFNTLVLVGFLIGSTLVAAGLKSRLVAFLLALINILFAFYQHPFFRYIRLEGGEWKYDEDNMPMPNVALPKDVSASDFHPSQIYDLHKYYFFLGLSTSGALLLLAQFGPGEIAAQKDEVFLPVETRAQD